MYRHAFHLEYSIVVQFSGYGHRSILVTRVGVLLHNNSPISPISMKPDPIIFARHPANALTRNAA
jgi:hypothetical protein